MQISTDISEWLTAAEKLIVQHKEQVLGLKIIFIVQKIKASTEKKKKRKAHFDMQNTIVGAKWTDTTHWIKGSLVKLSEYVLIYCSKVFANVFNIAKSYLCLLSFSDLSCHIWQTMTFKHWPDFNYHTHPCSHFARVITWVFRMIIILSLYISIRIWNLFYSSVANCFCVCVCVCLIGSTSS